MRPRDAIGWIRTVARSRDDLEWLKPTGDQWLLDLGKVNAQFPGLLASEHWAKGVHAITPDVYDEEVMKGTHVTMVEFCVTEKQVRGEIATPGHDRPIARRVLIGHGRSPLWRELKDFLHDRLHLDFEEFNWGSVAGLSTKERLLQMLDASSFAFLIMTAEDERSDGAVTARANVIHEVGLFHLEDGCEEFSNIVGVTQIRFPKGALDTKYEEIRRVLEREGVIDQRSLE
jgi:hypothetical protein